MRKLDMAQVKVCLAERLENDGREKMLQQMKQLQAAVYVMIGGGMLGRFAAEQPGEFYIDSRVCRLPYSRKAIYQAVQTLVFYAELLGFDAKRGGMPKDYFDVHNCGVW